MPGVNAPVALGDGQDNTQAEPPADQTRSLLSSQQPRSLSLARHALGTGMQKTLVTREAERNCLSAWSFFLHLELFQQMLIKL